MSGLPPAVATYGPMLLFAALMILVVYRRARSHIGPQTVQPRRMMIRAGMFCMMGASLVALAPLSALPYMIAGAAIGIGVGWIAVRLTAFDHTPAAVFYRANLYIGLSVTALLIGRVTYRLIQISGAFAAAKAHAADASLPPVNPWAGMVNNPLTLGILCITVGYYIVFYVGVVRKAKRTAPEINGEALSEPTPAA